MDENGEQEEKEGQLRSENWSLASAVAQHRLDLGVLFRNNA